MDETLPTEAPPEPSRTDLIIEEWFVTYFHNIGLDVQLYNRFHAAKEELQKRITQ